MADEDNGTDSLKEKIKDHIEVTGFPLEMFALNVCSKFETGREPSIRYEHEGRVQEIDLVTSFFRHPWKKRGNLVDMQNTVTSMVIECKKTSAKPWVLFSSRHYKFDDLKELTIYNSHFDAIFANERRPRLLSQIDHALNELHLGSTKTSRCVAYHEAFKTQDQPSAIYKAIDSVLKYIAYARLKHDFSSGLFSQFYVPVILLDGQLFQASIEGDDIEISGQQRLQLRTYYRHRLYVIEVVTKPAFEEFVKEISVMHNSIIKAIGELSVPRHVLNTARSHLHDIWEST
jgi:hypothetical protein